MTQLKGTAYWGAVAILVGCLLLTWQQPGVEAQSGLPPQHGGLGFGGPGGTFTGGTITSPILAPAAGNCTTPPYSFAGDSDSGFCSTLAGTTSIFADSTDVMTFQNGTVFVPSYTKLLFTDGSYGATHSSILQRGATGTLWLRASPSFPQAQEFHWTYSNYADASNYQGGVLKTSASGIEIAAETAGSGADNLNIVLNPAGGGQTQFFVGGGGPYWFISGIDGSFNSGFADAVDLGSSGAVRNLSLTRSIQGSKTKTLTDAAAAAAFVRIAVPQTVGSNYAGGDVVWTAFAADATPHTQSLSGRLTFTAINNAGTEVCAVDPTAAVTAPNANSSGTLQCTFSCASNAADTIDLMATCDTSLGTPTALSLLYRLDMPQPNTVTPQ